MRGALCVASRRRSLRGTWGLSRVLLSEDVVFHVPGTGAKAGDHRGQEEVLAFLEQAARLTEGMLRIRLHGVLVGEEYAAAVATYRATRSGVGSRWRTTSCISRASRLLEQR